MNPVSMPTSYLPVTYTLTLEIEALLAGREVMIILCNEPQYAMGVYLTTKGVAAIRLGG